MEKLLEAILNAIEMEMGRCYWNATQKGLPSPFQNTGMSYSNDTFTVRAYSWDEDENQKPNFEYKDLKIWWYKHSNRGLCFKTKGKITLEFLIKMIDDCYKSIYKETWKGDKLCHVVHLEKGQFH